jgi:hypothetical protein
LVTLIHDLELKRSRDHVDVSGTRQSVAPDGWINLHLKGADGTHQMCLFLEADRGTESQAQWREKVRRLALYYVNGGYKARYGTESLTIAVWVSFPAEHKWSSADARVKNLCQWTRAELEQLELATALPDLFWFSATPLTVPTVEESFFSPQWILPFSSDPEPLIPLPHLL